MRDHALWLTQAEEIARAAGALLRERWQQQHTVRSKGFRNVVTEADLAAEKLILSRLRDAFPDHTITSEEAGADTEHADIRWLVDPLDGTTNFSRNNPNFCVSLAAADAAGPVVGVVYDPLRDHCFRARRGGGATLNGAPVKTSGVTAFEHAVVATDWPRTPDLRSEHRERVGRLLDQGRTLRALGSAALNMVYVATGWFDLYLARHLSPWDHAAAALIVKEAGGALSTLRGETWHPLALDPVAAASPELITTLHTILSEETP
jgi:myo-inositol-1(or 4)-monophosphatase